MNEFGDLKPFTQIHAEIIQLADRDFRLHMREHLNDTNYNETLVYVTALITMCNGMIVGDIPRLTIESHTV